MIVLTVSAGSPYLDIVTLLVDHWGPAVEDEGGVAVIGDGLRVLREGELFRDGMALGGVDGMAVEVCAVELPEMQMGGVVLEGTPADRRDAFEVAVDEHGLGVGVVEAVIIG